MGVRNDLRPLDDERVRRELGAEGQGGDVSVEEGRVVAPRVPQPSGIHRGADGLLGGDGLGQGPRDGSGKICGLRGIRHAKSVGVATDNPMTVA